jgi:hypothetical protein
LFELTTYLESSGLDDPLLKIYFTTEPLDNLSMATFLHVISQFQKLGFDPRIGKDMLLFFREATLKNRSVD